MVSYERCNLRVCTCRERNVNIVNREACNLWKRVFKSLVMAKIPRAKHEERLHNHWQTPWLTHPTAEHLEILGLRNFYQGQIMNLDKFSCLC